VWPEDQRDETGAKLADLGTEFEYLYDFGDDWTHDVEVLGCGGPAAAARHLAASTAMVPVPPKTAAGQAGTPNCSTCSPIRHTPNTSTCVAGSATGCARSIATRSTSGYAGFSGRYPKVSGY
jgi:hypothetical protein